MGHPSRAMSVLLSVLWLALAAAAHAGGFWVLPAAQSSVPQGIGLTDVDVELVEVEEPEPEPDPEPILDEEPEEIVEQKLNTPKPPPEPPTEPEEPPAAAEETPLEFDNIVLTNESDQGSSWAVTPGSGKDKEGPIGSPDAVVTGESTRGKAGGVLGGTGDGVVVDVGDLSRAPKPPNIKRILERNYPKKARAEGIEGYANVRLQVGSNGMPSRFRIVSQSPEGYDFGRACVKSLRGKRWPRPPVDKNGRRVATRLNFRCGFKIRY